VAVNPPNPATPLQGLIQAARADPLRHALEFDLLNQPVVSAVAASGGMNAPLKLMLGNGWTAYFKAFSSVNMPLAMQYGHTDHMPPLLEVVAWKLAERIGPPLVEVMQPVVLREYDLGGGILELGAISLGANGIPNQVHVLNVEPVARICGFFDCLIGQQDRHDGNYKFESAQWRLGLFDHGFAFARPGDRFNSSRWVESCHSNGWVNLEPWQVDALDRLDASADTLGIAPMLPTDRLDALRVRVDLMRGSGQILALGQF